MELFNPHRPVIDFMRYRAKAATFSGILSLLSVIGIFFPGFNYGIDFRGGTELEVEFKGEVHDDELRAAVEELGYGRPDVIEVAGKSHRFIVRVQEVSALPAEQAQKIRAAVEQALGAGKIDAFKVSPGGDKIAIRLTETVPVEQVEAALIAGGAKIRSVGAFGPTGDHRYEAMLIGVGDQLVHGLKSKLGDRAPESPLRVEWVGPKAGQQLRTAALKSLLYTMAFIMVYIAFRFDLRFAPGGIIALIHDATIVAGAYVLFQKEFTLGTVAAILTVIGYSINDTIVIYDRIRENMARMRDASLGQIINISTTQTISRTLITSGVTELSILAFFIWGTPVIQDIVLALTVGFVTGTYSSIYIAAPVTEWMDRRWFKRA